MPYADLMLRFLATREARSLETPVLARAVRRRMSRKFRPVFYFSLLGPRMRRHLDTHVVIYLVLSEHLGRARTLRHRSLFWAGE
jgi:hypothetical protein